MPQEKFRGGFRFMTVVAKSRVEVSNISCAIGFSPSQPDLRDYSGFFWAPEDDLLTRIWYAGAYTVQTNIGPLDTGRFLPQVRPGWAYNSSTGVAGPILMDGAKRDRAVWPGDHGLTGNTAFLALGDAGLEAFRNALETMFYHQNSTTGRFPYAGPSTRSFNGGNASDTYHAWNLISIFNYAIFTGDEAWLDEHWTNITRGVDYILAGLDNDIGLHNQSTRYDWGRQGAGGYNSALNALDYHALTSLSSLATSLNRSTDLAAAWSAAASRLQEAYNTHLWDDAAGLYRDNTTTTLHPQDGNALALLYNLPGTAHPARSAAISAALTRNWNAIGPVTPELPDVISSFISSVEVMAHLSSSQSSSSSEMAARGLTLIRRLWSFLLDAPTMTGCTLAEGLAANGSLHYRGASGYNFDPAYTSMAHGWASGPTIALSTRVAGLEVVGWRRWRFDPAPGGLTRVEAGFKGPLGEFRVGWEVLEGGVLEANVTTPEGTEGGMEGLVEKCEGVEVDGVGYEGGVVVGGGGTKRVRAVGCVGL
ncbi:Bacterial alpha-L-rhamnosidase [Lasiodiplodia theobromae]|nr:Bacterial alpha-L-rhamnosidase [Lasiodiplodia theobromae]KAF4544889.1 Bacterial alpha-L-rhamnosidase [Lasiodiplodia theobromae]